MQACICTHEMAQEESSWHLVGYSHAQSATAGFFAHAPAYARHIMLRSHTGLEDAIGMQHAGCGRLRCLAEGCPRLKPEPINVHAELLAVMLLLDYLPVSLLDASWRVTVHKGRVPGLALPAAPGQVDEMQSLRGCVVIAKRLAPILPSRRSSCKLALQGLPGIMGRPSAQ